MKTNEIKIECPKGYEVDKEKSDANHIIITKTVTYNDVSSYIKSIPGYITYVLHC